MDNYGSSSSYPYNNSYGYPHHPPPSNHPYPPPNSDPYAPPPPPNFAYPYNSSNSFTYPQPMYPSVPSPSSPPSSAHHSGPLEYYHPPPPQSAPIPYPYPYPVSPMPLSSPQPSLQQHSSFQYGSSHYHYQQPEAYPPSETYSHAPGPANSFSSHSSGSFGMGSSPNHEVVHDSSPLYPPIYPQLDDHLSNLHLSDNHASAPASPSAPSVRDSPPRYPSLSGSNSFSSGWDSYSGRQDSPLHSAYYHSSSFNGSQHSQNLQIVPSKGSLKVLLLHGNLDICVNEAKNLPNMDMFHKTLGDVFGKLPGNVSNKIEGHMPHKITSDPYVSISVSGAVIGRTFVISNSENPIWKQKFYVPVAHHAAEVHFMVKDSDVVGSQLIGVVAIPVVQIYSGAKVEGTFPILNNGKQSKAGCVLSISIQYIPIEKLSIYHHGVGAGPDYLGVPGTYFPLRRGGTVTLYQDAHVPDGCLPSPMLAQGTPYVHGKCWHDIFDAICQAQRLIYITGWSVWDKVRLVRDASSAAEYTLGELLKSKSQEGVRVLLLLWDDPTSRNILGYKTDGIMQTHDEETRRFFKHSSVQVLLCPRFAGKRHSWIKQREVETIYTHHQKTVILDADAGYNRRKIIAFVGGLDLCDGRYDTPHHPLFRSLEKEHKDDYHNPTFTGNVAGCPREPWHDMHCKIDGPAAYDVLTNFQERWLKAAKPHGIKKLKMSYDDALLKIERIPDILGISDAPCLGENDPEAWHVQVFRSIDSNSVKGFPKDSRDAIQKNLVCGKNVLIDMSIHTAYVKAIRAAQHFIYIENQYFIGSSFNWTSYKNLGADNIIPMEIALKIANKIRANERFAAYIVVPMWPEGVPTGAATQRILFWQHKTMQMMYETIYKALEEVGLEEAFTPQDYLNFFCLGNREAVDGSETPGAMSPTAANTPQAHSRKNRRFMIYVHSKGMIVDDEYVILGSANINQRSMEGTRDTEIAMGAYQPHYTWARKLSNPRGQIYGYRMSLWAEHTGTIEDCFLEPESLECVKRVRSMGEMNWKQFASDDISEMRGHLLKYPVEVDRKGKVKPIPKCETFPDAGGNIMGSFLAIQENLTI
ncbi:phospholipase D beta 2-like [Vitis riparia]|uniref:phospholipase D beta 2-like n=1 Tax=Vitis riparia TaxID=96939 RepID=UPI00155AD557|nr:phospholipase D beta 2-like [Vitis riparia]